MLNEKLCIWSERNNNIMFMTGMEKFIAEQSMDTLIYVSGHLEIAAPVNFFKECESAVALMAQVLDVSMSKLAPEIDKDWTRVSHEKLQQLNEFWRRVFSMKSLTACTDFSQQLITLKAFEKLAKHVMDCLIKSSESDAAFKMQENMEKILPVICTRDAAFRNRNVGPLSVLVLAVLAVLAPST